MATGKRTYRAEATPMNAVALNNATVQYSNDVDLETDGYVGSHVQFSVAFHNNGNQAVNLFVYGGLEANNYDTAPLFSQQVPFSANNTIRLSAIIRDVLHFRLGAAHNNNETNNATVTIKEQAWRYDVS